MSRVFLAWGVLLILLAGRGLAAPSYPIVDTGQTKCYGASVEILPPAAGQLFYGQDAQVIGNQPNYKDNGDGTVTDLVTGLTWVKERGQKVSWATAMSGAGACRAGNFSDWRVPTIKELYSLIRFTGKSGATAAESVPYLDPVFGFAYGNTALGERVIDCQDWSATAYVSKTMNDATTIFGVNFADGRIKGYPLLKPGSVTGEPNLLYIRYVRGNPAYGINKFVDNQNDTITDTATGLTWSKGDSGTGLDWKYALAWVQAKNAENYLGHNDWRLPNAKELQSIVDYSRSPSTSQSAAISPLFTCTPITNEGGNTDAPFYWSSTTHLDNMGGVYVAFGRALGWMEVPPGSGTYVLMDVHGAGAQRSDPKLGSAADYPHGLGPQGDVIRVNNFVRLVRNADLPASSFQPDLQIRIGGTDNAFTGDNIYNLLVAEQRREQWAIIGGTPAYYVVKIQNDGTATDTFVLKGPAAPQGWLVKYVDAAQADRTAEVSSANGCELTLDPGAAVEWYVMVKTDGVAPEQVFPVTLAAFSKGDPNKVDFVVMDTRSKAKGQPDMQAMLKTETVWSFNDVYGPEGINQVKVQEVGNGVFAAYYFAIQNDGGLADTFKLRAPIPPKGWKATIYDAQPTGWVDITATITSTDGFTSASLLPGKSQVFYVAVAPDATAGGSTEFGMPINAVSQNDMTKIDAVRLVTKVAARTGVDLLARTKAETTFSFDNVYGSDGLNQLKRMEVANGAYAAYYVGVQNEGNTADTYVVKAPPAPKGWKVMYYNTTDWSDITTAISSEAGWTTPSVAGGAVLQVYVAVAPDSTVAGAAECPLLVGALSTTDPAKGDAVRLVTNVIARKSVDLLARTKAETVWSFDNVYGLDGLNQMKRQEVPNGSYAAYYVGIQNEGNAEDSFLVKAPPIPKGWKALFYNTNTPNWTDITTAITSEAGYATDKIPGGGLLTLYIAVMPDATVTGAGEYPITLGAASQTDTMKYDVVRLVTTVPVRRGLDVLAKGKADTAWNFDNVYGLDGMNQQQKQPADSAVYVGYYVGLQNEGNATDTILVKSRPAAKGWKVLVYDCSVAPWADITAQITADAGWTTDVVSLKMLYVAVKPEAGADLTFVMPFLASSTSDPTKADAVQLVTNIPVKRGLDLLAKGKSDTAWACDNVYSADGVNQQVKQPAEIGTYVGYYVGLQNEGNAPDTLVVRAKPAVRGWKQVIYDCSVAPWADITAQITSTDGWTTEVVSLKQLYIVVKPELGAEPTFVMPVNAVSKSDGTKLDCVQLVTNIPIKLQPDMQVKTKTDTVATGDNIYNTSFEGQKRDTTVALGAYATYYALLQNDGNVADTFNVRSVTVPAGWKVTVYDPAFNDITAAVTGANGWTTPNPVAPGATLSFYVAVCPTTAVPGGASFAFGIGATSVGDTTKKDAVQMVTNVVAKLQPDMQVKAKTDTAPLGDNVYNTSFEGQKRDMSVATGAYAAFYAILQNDGNMPDTFNVRANPVPAGWKVTVYDPAFNDITTAVTSEAGWTTPNALAPGASVAFYVAVSPTATVPGGASFAFGIGATSIGDGTKKDAVQMITNVGLKSQADVLIRNRTENAFFGDNVYSTDGANQVRGAVGSTTEFAAYYVAVQNDGNAAADLTVKATVDGTGWKVVIYNATTWEDVTAKITAGATLPAVAPGAMVQYYVAVKAISPAGNCTVAMGATVGTDTTKADVARLITEKPATNPTGIQ
jgi:uncharacterized membrane protein